MASPYQAYDWVRLWHHYVSPHDGMTPCLIVGFDATDEPAFLWPFVRDSFGPFRIATFFGGKHATINMALWRRDVADSFTAADMKAVLARVATMAPDLDFLLLFNQPYRWSDAANPFALAAAAPLDRGQFRAAARRPERRNPGARAFQLDAQPPAQQGKEAAEAERLPLCPRHDRAGGGFPARIVLQAEGRRSSRPSVCTMCSRIPASRISFAPPVTTGLKPASR